jgi:hypothetical protein
LVIREGNSEEFVVAVKEIGNGPLGHVDLASDKVGPDFGYGSVFGISKSSDECDDVESELVSWECKGPLGFGSIRPLVGSASWVVAATDGEIEACDAGESVEGPTVGVVGSHGATAVWAVGPFGREVVGDGRLGYLCLLQGASFLGLTQSLQNQPVPIQSGLPV